MPFRLKLDLAIHACIWKVRVFVGQNAWSTHP